jgi:hypothetical protein
MSKVILSNCQQEALDAFIEFINSEDPWMVISGFAGSGKTFLVKHMADVAVNVLQLHGILDKYYRAPTIQFTATTNKAAAVLSEMLGQKVTTIHSLLGLKVVNNYKTGAQKLESHGKAIKTPNSIVFIDEASMVNRELLHFIKEYQQTTADCKLIFIGDPYQLPPVKEGSCNVFNAKDRHYFLDEIQRQMVGSPIIELSAQYRDVLDDPELPWPRIESDGQQLFFYDRRKDFDAEITKAMGVPHDPRQYKVLAWKNDTVRDYNKWIRALHGYTAPFELNEIVMTNKPILDGKQVMAPTDSLHRITNIEDETLAGVVGFNITLADPNNYRSTFTVFQPLDWKDANALKKQFAADAKDNGNWAPYFQIKGAWADLRQIHSLTCHKAQGSTYREVFVDLNDIGLNKRWQETARLAYVAVTRASHRLHVYGSITCNHTATKQRNTLAESFKNVEHLL